MLIIRKEQMRVLSQITREAFEGRMVTHLGKHFPAARAMEEQALREVIQYGQERAEKHGFRSDRDVARYLNLMFTFGRDFDRDQPWAAELFQEPVGMNALYAAGIERFDSGRGL